MNERCLSCCQNSTGLSIKSLIMPCLDWLPYLTETLSGSSGSVRGPVSCSFVRCGFNCLSFFLLEDPAQSSILPILLVLSIVVLFLGLLTWFCLRYDTHTHTHTHMLWVKNCESVMLTSPASFWLRVGPGTETCCHTHTHTHAHTHTHTHTHAHTHTHTYLFIHSLTR